MLVCPVASNCLYCLSNNQMQDKVLVSRLSAVLERPVVMHQMLILLKSAEPGAARDPIKFKLSVLYLVIT